MEGERPTLPGSRPVRECQPTRLAFAGRALILLTCPFSRTTIFMHVALLRLELRVDACRALAQKHRFLRAMIKKIHKHFNVAVAEVDRFDLPTESVLGVVALTRNRAESRKLLVHVAEAVAAHPHAMLTREPTIKDL